MDWTEEGRKQFELQIENWCSAVKNVIEEDPELFKETFGFQEHQVVQIGNTFIIR